MIEQPELPGINWEGLKERCLTRWDLGPLDLMVRRDPTLPQNNIEVFMEGFYPCSKQMRPGKAEQGPREQRCP